MGEEFESPFSYDQMDMNPVIGYGGMDMGGSSYATAPSIPRMPIPGINQMRELSYLQRMGRMLPMGRAGNGPRGHVHTGGTGINNQVMPGAGDQASQDAMNKSLGEYGQSLPSNPNPNAIFPNSGFFGDHPRLTAGLEGAMFGAANTQGGDTIGQNISGVMQGFINGRQQRANMVNQQFEAPVQRADMMGKLRQMSDQHSNVQSEIADRQSIMDFRKHQMENPPDKDKYSVHFDQQGHPWKFDATSGEAQPVTGTGDTNFNKPTHQQQPPASLMPYMKSLNIDPEHATPQDWKRVIAARVKDEAQRAGAKEGSREYSRIETQVHLGVRDQTETYLENQRRQQSGQPSMTAEETLAFRDNLPAVHAEASARGREKVQGPIRDQRRADRVASQADRDKQAWMRKFEGNDNFWAARGIKPKDEKGKSDYYDKNKAAVEPPPPAARTPQSSGSALQKLMTLLDK